MLVLMVMEEMLMLAPMTQGLLPSASKMAVLPAVGGALLALLQHAPPLEGAQLAAVLQSVEVVPSHQNVGPLQVVLQAACTVEASAMAATKKIVPGTIFRTRART